MQYTMQAIPTKYNGVEFRSRLEARWAAFFDIIDWKWQYEPLDLNGWIPDFLVKFVCSHSECNGYHELLVEIKPIQGDCENLRKYAQKHAMGKYLDKYTEPNAAIFGLSPEYTYWSMAHGAGCGTIQLYDLVSFWEDKWKEASNICKWNPDSSGALPKLDIDSLNSNNSKFFK